MASGASTGPIWAAVVEQTAATPAREALRPDLDLATASAITRALTGPEIFESLVLDSGWDPDRHEDWVRQTLVDQLLTPPKATPGTR